MGDKQAAWEKYPQRADCPAAGVGAGFGDGPNDCQVGDRLMLRDDHSKLCVVTNTYVAEDGPNGCCKSRVLGLCWADDCSADDNEMFRYREW